MDTRTRWIVGILIALVIGLAVSVIIIAADDSSPTQTVTIPTDTSETRSTTTESTGSTTTGTTGGTPAPSPGTTTSPGGSGGL